MHEKISKIKSIEDESLRIVDSAKNEASALIESAKQQSRKILETANLEAEKEAYSLKQTEEESINKEIKDAMKRSAIEEEALRKSASARIEQAKEYVINKILEHYSN